MKYLRIIVFVIASVMAMGAAAQKKYVEVQEMYLYGLGYALDDSVAYVTAVMPVKGVWKQKGTNFLYARNEYSRQYADCLKAKDVSQPMTVVSYGKTRAQAEKKFLKMIKKVTKDGYQVRHVSENEFAFKCVEYIAPEVEGEPVARSSKKSAKKTKKSKK